MLVLVKKFRIKIKKLYLQLVLMRIVITFLFKLMHLLT